MILYQRCSYPEIYLITYYSNPHPPSLSLQPYLDCCNSCEEVHKAYRRIDWALNPNKIDQVCLHESLPIQIYLESTNILY